MSKRRLAAWTIALVAVVAAVGYRASVFRGPATPPTPRIVLVTGGSGPYWQITVIGAKAAAREHDVDLQIEMPADDESLDEQLMILTHLDLVGLDGVAVSPLDAEGQTHLINRLVRKVRVVTFDSDAPLSDRQSHVGTSNFSAGRACARMVSEAIPDGGKIAVLLANLTKENMIDRKGGFQERISQLASDGEDAAEKPRFSVVGYFEDNGNSDKCAENIRAILAEHPDVACIVGMNARHGPILLRVLKDEDKLGQVKLVTFDEAAETLDGIETGHIYATIAQDPYKYGYEAVRQLASLCRGHGIELPIVGRGSVYVGAEAIRQDNVGDFRNRLRGRQEAVQNGAGKP
jgi:ribose transport system substrate-binding protein